jgi:hypothetical protein
MGGFLENCLRLGKLRLGGAQGVAQRLRVEFGDQVVRPYHLPHIHSARDHPAIDAEREAFLGAGADLTGNSHQFSFRVRGRRHRPDRTDFGGRGRLLFAANQQSQYQPGKNGCRSHRRPHAPYLLRTAPAGGR